MFKKILNYLKSKKIKEPEQGPDLNVVKPLTGQNLLKIPFAVQNKSRMKSRGTYPNKYPMGAVVHFTAGRFKGGLAKAIDTIQGGIDNGFNFLCISYDGKIVQACDLDKWGYHAGQSAWNIKGKKLTAVSQYLVGIEINNAGNLTKKGDKFFSWYGEEIPADEVRQIVKSNDSQAAGYYHKYTDAQEKALIELLIWLKANNPKEFDLDLVIGHSECAGIKGIGKWRKVDPSGSLSMPMDKFRELIKAEYKKRYG